MGKNMGFSGKEESLSLRTTSPRDGEFRILFTYLEKSYDKAELEECLLCCKLYFTVEENVKQFAVCFLLPH